MKKIKEFPFKRARPITSDEVEKARTAIEKKLGSPRPARGRPRKLDAKFIPISIRLHPRALEWAKNEAKRRGVGYQTIINEILLKKAD